MSILNIEENKKFRLAERITNMVLFKLSLFIVVWAGVISGLLILSSLSK